MLQAVLAPGDQVQQVVLAGSITNDTGERPIVAYLFGVEAIGVANQSALGVVRLSCIPPHPILHWTEIAASPGAALKWQTGSGSLYVRMHTSCEV